VDRAENASNHLSSESWREFKQHRAPRPRHPSGFPVERRAAHREVDAAIGSIKVIAFASR
jgi:hypothetical protein